MSVGGSNPNDFQDQNLVCTPIYFPMAHRSSKDDDALIAYDVKESLKSLRKGASTLPLFHGFPLIIFCGGALCTLNPAVPR